ncbi:hypothetical protein L4D76_03620 [Photobacterium sagamiensis]|uniref:hypothetical protein n=1 Tax=Photobacterium sagamiensis TaxID=2910241 RepID=UPI003D10093D
MEIIHHKCVVLKSLIFDVISVSAVTVIALVSCTYIQCNILFGMFIGGVINGLRNQ